MVKILLLLDENNRIKKVNTNTTDLTLNIGDGIDQIFPDQIWQDMLRQIQGCRLSDDSTTATSQIILNEGIVSVAVFIIHLNGAVSILILDGSALDIKSHDACFRIYNDYINLMREEFRKLSRRANSEEVNQLQEFHQLNNELINTKRLLQKSNAKLNSLNAALEGRLVKDALTGLVSRYQYWSAIEQMIQRHSNRLGVFVFIDLDGFKSVNDTFGHSAGDQFLIEFGRRLNSIDMDETIKIRIAGDEFALYIHGYEEIQHDTIEEIWEKINSKVLYGPIEVNGIMIPVSVSCGMAVYGQDTDNIGQLIEYADFAMYKSKKSGKGRYTLFKQSEYIKHYENDERIEELNRIIRDKDFYHVFQPFIGSKTLEVEGYSVQLRTRSSVFKNTTDLISFAYEVGSYRELDRASMSNIKISDGFREKLKNKSLLITHGPYPIADEVVSNLYVDSLKDVGVVFEIWMPVNIEPKEMAKIKESGRVINGRLSLANFGVENTDNLIMLAIEPDIIRFNKKLVRKAMIDKDIEKALQNIITYCKIQGTKTLGDFVENEEDLNFLKNLGFDYLQGFYISYPKDNS
jgi:diguanylate cyclase (GGDEF)-like protein